jgi:transposase
MQVNHICGNRRCCNPWHLYAGTQKENFQDMLRHGTHKAPPLARGEKVGNASLSDAEASQVKKLLLAGASCSKLAETFGVSLSTISLIKRNKRYAHVEPFMPVQEKYNKPRVTSDQIREIKARLANGETGRAIALSMGLNCVTISRIRVGRAR